MSLYSLNLKSSLNNTILHKDIVGFFNNVQFRNEAMLVFQHF